MSVAPPRRMNANRANRGIVSLCSWVCANGYRMRRSCECERAERAWDLDASDAGVKSRKFCFSSFALCWEAMRSICWPVFSLHSSVYKQTRKSERSTSCRPAHRCQPDLARRCLADPAHRCPPDPAHWCPTQPGWELSLESEVRSSQKIASNCIGFSSSSFLFRWDSPTNRPDFAMMSVGMRWNSAVPRCSKVDMDWL